MGFGWAKVGVQCVCRDSSGSWDDDERLVNGEIYTIESVWIDDDNEICFDLIEVSRSTESVMYWINTRIGYSAKRFRPLVSLEDDISMFTALTNMSPIERLDVMKEMMDQ